MFSYFESLINPYPSEVPKRPPSTMLAFFWHYTKSCWHIIAIMTLTGIVFSVVEVYLFSFLGNIIDWLGTADRETFFSDEGYKLLTMLAVIVVVIPMLSMIHSLLMHQSILGNYGMIMRWQMHRYLLRQSMSFFADEFAGRVATKVMQTSLAVRDATVAILDVMVFVSVYFLGALVLVGTFHWLLVLPFVGWLLSYLVMLWFFLPRMAEVSERQADARSEMTGRVVDSYTNIPTVKMFAHADYEDAYVKDGMEGFLDNLDALIRSIAR